MTIVQNKKAHHDYSIEERYEAGIALEGWEVKSIRANQVQLNEAYVIVRKAVTAKRIKVAQVEKPKKGKK